MIPAVLRSKIGFKLLGLVVGTIIVSLGLLAYLILQREQKALKRLYMDESTLVANTITEALVESMIEKDLSRLKRIINTYNSLGLLKVAVFKNDGSVVYGGITSSLPPEIFSAEEKAVESEKKLLFFKPLRNEQRCLKCHNDPASLRGAIVVEVSKAPLLKELHDTQLRVTFFIMIAVLIGSAGIVFFLNRTVITPLHTLHRGASQLKEGNLGFRFSTSRKDEIGLVEEAFNKMAETIQRNHITMAETIKKRTNELRVIARVSSEVIGDTPVLEHILERFSEAITGELGYRLCAIYLLDTDRSTLKCRYSKAIYNGLTLPEDIPLNIESPYRNAVLQTDICIYRAEEADLPVQASYIILIPLISHRSSKCHEIVSCQRRQCPAFESQDIYCWLKKGTLCEEHGIPEDARPIKCLGCKAYPVTGLLIVGTEQNNIRESLHSLEIVASEIVSSVELYTMIKKQKEDIVRLLKLHDLVVDMLQHLQLESLSRWVVNELRSFFNIDASILWLSTERQDVEKVTTSGLKTPPENSLLQELMHEDLAEVFDTTESDTIRAFFQQNSLKYMVSVPLRLTDTIHGYLGLCRKEAAALDESDRAILKLFATQIASAIATAKIHKELKEEKELSEAIFNSTVTGVMLIQKDTGRILKINKAGAEILQRPVNTLVNKKLKDIQDSLQEMTTVSPHNREIEITTPSGTRTIGFTTSPIVGQSREDTMIVFFRDISELKRLQAAIRRKQHFEALGKVISGVAHEIRNPLFAIQSIGQIIEKETESPTHQLLIQTLLKEARRMKRLVDELLFYSRPSKLHVTDIELYEFFKELREYIKVKNFAISVKLDIQQALKLRADRDRLMQVFRNLVDNAIEAEAQHITIQAHQREEQILIKISDDGHGIKEQDLEKVFDLFFTTKKEGTGLGLAICRKIIEDHKGELYIQSRESEGTVVTIRFSPESL